MITIKWNKGQNHKSFRIQSFSADNVSGFVVKSLLSNCCEVFDVIWVPPRGRNMSSVLWDAISGPLGERIRRLYASSFCTQPCQDKWRSIHQLYGTRGDCQLGPCHTNSLCVSPVWTYLHCLAVTKEMYNKSLVQRNCQVYITESISILRLSAAADCI